MGCIDLSKYSCTVLQSHEHCGIVTKNNKWERKVGGIIYIYIGRAQVQTVNGVIGFDVNRLEM